MNKIIVITLMVLFTFSCNTQREYKKPPHPYILRQYTSKGKAFYTGVYCDSVTYMDSNNAIFYKDGQKNCSYSEYGFSIISTDEIKVKIKEYE